MMMMLMLIMMMMMMMMSAHVGAVLTWRRANRGAADGVAGAVGVGLVRGGHHPAINIERWVPPVEARPRAPVRKLARAQPHLQQAALHVA